MLASRPAVSTYSAAVVHPHAGTACAKTRVKHGGNKRRTQTCTLKGRARWNSERGGRELYYTSIMDVHCDIYIMQYCGRNIRNKPANYNVNVKMSDCRQRDGRRRPQ